MKIATRFLLPLEMFLAVIMLSWGISGWVGGGQFWRTLHAAGQSTEWGVALCGFGAAHLAMTALEWFMGRRWADHLVLTSVQARLASGFFSIVVWLYACFLLATLHDAWRVSALILQAPLCLGASLWIFVENFRAACVLDPDCPTEQLQRRLFLERVRKV